MLCKAVGLPLIQKPLMQVLTTYVTLSGQPLLLYWFLRRTTRNFKLLAGTNMGAYLNSRS